MKLKKITDGSANVLSNISSGRYSKIAAKGVSGGIHWASGGIFGKKFQKVGPWPQTFPENKGFLPQRITTDEDKETLKRFGLTDWRGVLIDTEGKIGYNVDERISPSKVFPKKSSKLDYNDTENLDPYSSQDIYKIFNDYSTNYFKHGIYIDKTASVSDGPSTPEENNDPVIFGFDIIIDVIQSPLLNGSIDDFFKQFDSIGEISSKIPVYEDFKKQFIKLFKTNADVYNIDDEKTFSLNQTGKDGISLTANSDEQNSLIHGKKAYMSYYLKKVGGLKNLSESNGSSTFKYLTEYKKDTISLSFLEDVSLTLGTLANLYKLLYWSKPNGKSIIPENLLRFNCKIIVSELRNFSRVRSYTSSPDSTRRVEVIKDNLSRYVYDLKECQLFFDTLSHDDNVDNTTTDVTSDYSVNFNYKFSSMTFERFNPNTFIYHSYNNGGMWGSDGRQTIRDSILGTSIEGNGYDKEFIIKSYNKGGSLGDDSLDNDGEMKSDLEKEESGLDKFKKIAKKARSSKLGKIVERNVRTSIRNEVNTRLLPQVALLNASIDKVLSGFAQNNGIREPFNVYTDTERTGLKRFESGLRNDISIFAGDSISNMINNNLNNLSF